MSVIEIALILMGSFLLLLTLGLEIFAAMGFAACLGFLLFVNQSTDWFANVGWTAMNNFTWTAVPLFIFMGDMFANTGVIRRLYDGMEKFVSNWRGGLATSTIAACAVFGAMSGSSVAASATFGTIAYPQMERKGYDPTLSLGTIAVGGGLSVLIPPSLVLIVYGGWQQLSVAQLFAAALIPGIILALLYIITIMILTWLKPNLAPAPYTLSWRERLSGVKELAPWVGIVVLVLGVIFAGIMTPTESASLGAFLGIVAALAYRQMSFAAFKKSALTAVRVTAMVALIITSARVLGYVFQVAGLTDAFAAFITGLGWGKYGTLVVIFLMYFFLGCFMDGISMMLITFPFVVPIMGALNVDLIWWGVAFVVIDETALVTPPYGLNLFALKSVIPKASLLRIALGTLYFFPAIFALLALITAFPEISLWLPGIMY